MWKKCLLFLCLYILAFSFGCEANTNYNPSPYIDVDILDDIWIEVEQENISSDSVKISIINTSERDDFFTGLWYCIEEKNGDAWYSLPLQDYGGFFPSLAIKIPTASEISSGFIDGIHYNSESKLAWQRNPPNEMVFKFEYLYGKLSAGDYRIIIEVMSENDIPIEDSDKYYLSAPFSIK